MNKEEVLANLRTAILEGEEGQAAQIAEGIVNDSADLIEFVDAAIATIRVVGDRFGEGEVFLPEMVLSAEAMQAFMKVMTPHLGTTADQARVAGKAIVATVKGDIHSIGKNIVATMLSASGFEVNDMGVDVSPMEMIQTAEKLGAEVIGLSALMTTSMPYQKEVVDLLNELGQRDDFYVILGGGPVTRDYAEKVGANGWAADAAAAVRVCERLLSGEGTPSTTEFVYFEE